MDQEYSVTIDKLQRQIQNQKLQIDMLRNKFFALQEAFISSNLIQIDEHHKDSVASVLPIGKRMSTDSDVLILVFSGMATRLGMPPAEFMRTFLNKKVNIIFLKDFKQCWYQKGLLGLTQDVSETISYLRREIMNVSPKKIISLGTSSGGFASILFGVLLDIQEVLAFSPQTYITKQVFQKFRSTDSRISEMDFDSPYMDLKKIIETTNFSGKINVFFGEDNTEDKNAALYINHFECVNLVALPTEQHNTAAFLKKADKLDSLFADISLD